MLIVVGGHTRNIGKTSVMEGLIRCLHQHRWTAIKITQFGHGVCASAGEACGCETELAHPYALDEEFEPGNRDSSRFLAAGARRAFWLRTASGELASAVPVIRRIIQSSPNTIVESNSILEFFKPDLYLVVLDFAHEDFKLSTRRFLNSADAFIVINHGIAVPPWEDVAQVVGGRRRFLVQPPQYVTPAICSFVEERLAAVSSRSTA